MYHSNALSRCETTGFAKGEYFLFHSELQLFFGLTIPISRLLCQQCSEQQRQSRNDGSWMLSFPTYSEWGKAAQKEKENQGQTSTAIILLRHITGSVQNWALLHFLAKSIKWICNFELLHINHFTYTQLAKRLISPTPYITVIYSEMSLNANWGQHSLHPRGSSSLLGIRRSYKKIKPLQNYTSVRKHHTECHSSRSHTDRSKMHVSVSYPGTPSEHAPLGGISTRQDGSRRHHG